MAQENPLYLYERAPLTSPISSVYDYYWLAEKVGTPYYIVEESTLNDRYEQLKEAYAGFNGTVRIALSIKANFNPYVLRFFIKKGSMFDLTSPEELFFLLHSGGSSDRVVYTSVTERLDEYEEILSKGVKRVVVASFSGLMNLMEAAERLNLVPEVGIRINPEVPVKAEIKASYKNGKFGVPIGGSTQDNATNMIKSIYSTPNLKFIGFHFHLGSQIEDPSAFIQALDKLKAFSQKLKREIPAFELKMLDVGGGMPVNYGIRVPSPKELGTVVTERLNNIKEELGYDYDLYVESGRYLTAESSSLLTKIVNIKNYSSHKYIYVDAGYHLLLDTALVHQIYPMEVLPSTKEEPVKTTVAGRLCDTMDVFPIGPEAKLGGAKQGKLMMIKNVGAYSLVFNMPFHSQVKPAVVYRDVNGKYFLARKRQTIDELFQEEGGDLLNSCIQID